MKPVRVTTRINTWGITMSKEEFARVWYGGHDREYFKNKTLEMIAAGNWDIQWTETGYFDDGHAIPTASYPLENFCKGGARNDKE